MTAGNPNLRDLDSDREHYQRRDQKLESAGVAETKGHPHRHEDQEMLQALPSAGYWTDRRGADGKCDDNQDQQPSRDLK